MRTADETAAGCWGLTGAVAVVIGGSQGIGAAVAVGLAGAGAEVVIAGRDGARLAATADDAAATGIKIATEIVDVRDPASIQDLRDRVNDNYGPPTVLVNSMGGTVKKNALETRVADWDDLFDTHLRGSFLACQAFAPGMRDVGYGKMINVTSTSGVIPVVNRSAYSSAKAGLSHLTAALAAEWGPLGIRVNAIAPGLTLTPRAQATMARHPEREAYALERIPLRTIAEPEDMVGPALFLASRQSDYVSGHTLVVDGGWVTTKSTANED
jgi:NAD(P)-dependent dehydrogenase (short-subunit alcohol dehydrogenase family)